MCKDSFIQAQLLHPQCSKPTALTLALQVTAHQLALQKENDNKEKEAQRQQAQRAAKREVRAPPLSLVEVCASRPHTAVEIARQHADRVMHGCPGERRLL